MPSLASLFVFVLMALPVSAAGVFTVSGRGILLDGDAFEIKGLCYQPTPIGESGGLPPFGDYYTKSGQNALLWARDFPNFRRMGANVIRLYGWTIGEDHSTFLDAAYNGGKNSVYVLINRYINPETDWTDATAVDALIGEWEAIATELADHPAVMGFLIGNEVNPHFNPAIGMVNGDDQSFWVVMEEIAAAVKNKAPNKLVSVAITDRLDQIDAFDYLMASLDFWAVQIYRGSSFTDLFTAYPPKSTKPLVITEFGYDALDGRIDTEWPDNAERSANAIESLWNELRADDAASDIVAGACVFEYVDEWWKAEGELTDHDFGPRWPGPFEDGQGNEEWWGIFRALDNGEDIDILQPRALFYRLAAMWNDPFKSDLWAVAVGDDLEVSFAYPVHLRDQALEFQLSGNLDTWEAVADNSDGSYLEALDPSVSLSNLVGAETIEVTVTLSDPVAPIDPEMIVNGGFDEGTTAGWETPGSVVPSVFESGTHSIVLAGSGGFSVPTAFQTWPASPGDDLVLSGYLYTAEAIPADVTFGVLKIVFRDSAGRDLEPAEVLVGRRADVANPGGESLPLLNAASPVGEWIYSEVRAVAPAGTTAVSFFLLNVDESPATMYFDSISAQAFGATAEENPRVFFRLTNHGR